MRASRIKAIHVGMFLALCLVASACGAPASPTSAPAETPPMAGSSPASPPTSTQAPAHSPTAIPSATTFPSPTPSQTPVPSLTPIPTAVVIRLEADGSGDYPGLKEAVQSAPAGAILSLGAGVFRLEQPLEIDKPLSLVGQGLDQTEIVSTAADFTIHVKVQGAFQAEGIAFRHEGQSFADVMEVETGQVTFKACRFSGGVRDEQNKERGDGLRLREGASGLVQDCLAEENFTGMRALGKGITLERNRSQNNMAGFGFGAETDTLARDNQALENQYNGFVMFEKANPTLEGNTSSKNGLNGFWLLEESAGKLTGNNAVENQSNGMLVVGQAHPQIEGNTCSQNQGNGIWAIGEAQPLIQGNTCDQNGGHGISLGEQARGEIRGNTCSENGMSGILAADSTQVTIEDNTTNENARFGISVGVQASAVVRGNTARQNQRFGILAAENATAELQDNLCAENGLAGIAFLDSAGGSASGNECTGNETGIYVQAGASPTLGQNDCHDNTRQDILDERP